MIGLWLLSMAGCAPSLPMLTSTGSCTWVDEACHLPEDVDLVLWLPQRGEVTLDVGSVAPSPSVRPEGTGLQLTWTAPVPEGPLRISLHNDKTWVDGFEVVRPPPPTAAVVEAQSALDTGSACESRIGALVRESSPTDRGPLLERWAACDRRANANEYRDRMELAAAAYRQAGQSSQAAKSIAAHIYFSHNDPALVERLFDSLEAGRDANIEWSRRHIRARVLESRGDVGGAEQEDTAALQTATQTAMHARGWRTQNARAIRADALGDPRKAYTILRRHVPEEGIPYRRALLWHREKNMLWYTMNSLQQGGPTEVPLPELRRRLQRLEKSPPRYAAQALASLKVDRARAALLDDDDDDAKATLREAMEDLQALGAVGRHWAHALEAQLASRRGDVTSARTAWKRALEEADSAQSAGLRVRCLVGLGELERAAGRPSNASRHLEDARAAIADGARRLPFEIERGSWFDGHADVIGAQLRLLLEQADPPAAFTLLRQAHAERLNALDQVTRSQASPPADRKRWTPGVDRFRAIQRQIAELEQTRWSLPDDEIHEHTQSLHQLRRDAENTLDGVLRLQASHPAPALQPLHPGELVLAWWPHGRDLLAFAASTDGVSSAVVPRGASDAALLEPFSTEIQNAALIRLIAGGRVASRDLHTTQIAGEPLIAWAPVVWTLDRPPTAPKTTSTPLVIGDPRGDLPHARAEARVVAQQWGIEALLGDAATRQVVLNRLQTATRVHIASHASQGAHAGLHLADGSLGVGDILTLGAVPTEVFLSGCETGSTSYSLGLAQSFTLAGSNTVVGSTRPVSDIHAKALVTTWASGDTLPVERLAQAQLLLHTTHPDADWSAWRVWAR